MCTRVEGVRPVRECFAAWKLKRKKKTKVTVARFALSAVGRPYSAVFNHSCINCIWRKRPQGRWAIVFQQDIGPGDWRIFVQKRPEIPNITIPVLKTSLSSRNWFLSSLYQPSIPWIAPRVSLRNTLNTSTPQASIRNIPEPLEQLGLSRAGSSLPLKPPERSRVYRPGVLFGRQFGIPRGSPVVSCSVRY